MTADSCLGEKFLFVIVPQLLIQIHEKQKKSSQRKLLLFCVSIEIGSTHLSEVTARSLFAASHKEVRLCEG